jgi:hypothetical protein
MVIELHERGGAAALHRFGLPEILNSNLIA